jgi:hypothetical protein
MTEDSINVCFGQYMALLKTLYSSVSGLLVFDGDAGLIWRDEDSPVDQEQIQSLLPNFIRGDADSQFQKLRKGSIGELIKLKNELDQVALVVCLCSEHRDMSEVPPLARRNSFNRLSEILLANYCQNIELANKEDELSRRHEELNLIYKAETPASNVYHGRELLRQLVLNTARFLNVDIIYLYIAGQNVSMRKFRNDDPIFQADALFKCLRGTVHPLLQTEGRFHRGERQRGKAKTRYRYRPALQVRGQPGYRRRGQCYRLVRNRGRGTFQRGFFR